MTPLEATMIMNVAVAVIGIALMAYAMKLCLFPVSKQLA